MPTEQPLRNDSPVCPVLSRNYIKIFPKANLQYELQFMAVLIQRVIS